MDHLYPKLIKRFKLLLFVKYWPYLSLYSIFNFSYYKNVEINYKLKKKPSRIPFAFFRTIKKKSILIWLLPQLFNFFKTKKVNPLFFNKFFCFWPVKYKKNINMKVMNKILKTFKNLKNKFFKLLAKSLKRRPLKLFKITTKKKPRAKVSRFINFHRRQIKVFWQSQEVFKTNFLRKMRLTTRKFSNKFKYWYHKNKKTHKNFELKLIYVITQNFLFFSSSRIDRIFDTNILLKNGAPCKDRFEPMLPGDILTFPLNYSKYIYFSVIGKFASYKFLKKKNYIYFKNKLSQWKNIKKQPIKELFYNFNSLNNIQNYIEYNIFSSSLCIIKKQRHWNRFFNSTPRHNLEKLNTYKLNV